MASRFLKTVTLEEVTELKEAAVNLNTRKSTINWLRDFKEWCDGNRQKKVKARKIIRILTKRVKLFPHFTRHHLILYNKPSYSRILIGSCLFSIRGQIHY